MPDESDIRVVEAGYLRWMLRANPFSYLSSESLERVMEVHVDTKVDEVLGSLIEEALKKKVKELIFLIGEFGMGKTHRLRLIKEIFEDIPSFYVKIDVDDFETSLKRIAETLALKRLVPIKTFKKKIPEDPDSLKSLIVREISKFDHIILMLDEVENIVVLGTKKDAEKFTKFINYLYKGLPSGGIILIACIPPAYDLMKPLLKDIPHKVIHMRKIELPEAQKILRKRFEMFMEGAEGIKPGRKAPFSKEIVKKLNEMAGGNPRRLMKLARNLLAMLTRELKESGRLDEDKIVNLISYAEKGEVAEQVEAIESNEDEEKEKEIKDPDEFNLRESFGDRPFSLIEASRALSKKLSDVREIIDRLLEEGKLKKLPGGRYSFT